MVAIIIAFYRYPSYWRKISLAHNAITDIVICSCNRPFNGNSKHGTCIAGNYLSPNRNQIDLYIHNPLVLERQFFIDINFPNISNVNKTVSYDTRPGRYRCHKPISQ